MAVISVSDSTRRAAEVRSNLFRKVVRENTENAPTAWDYALAMKSASTYMSLAVKATNPQLRKEINGVLSLLKRFVQTREGNEEVDILELYMDTSAFTENPQVTRALLQIGVQRNSI